MRPKKNFSRVVVKVGASLFSTRDNKIDLSYLGCIAAQINQLREGNKEVILVSSGAVACGMSLLDLRKRPGDVISLQALAAIGQNELMGIYRKLFSSYKLLCAQILLTWEDFENRSRYLNVRHTLTNLLGHKVLPIINENDTVSTDEIRFGDNDKLSALVANLIGADLLVILSDVDGLYRLPRKEVIGVVEKITPEITRLCCNTDKHSCVGGMSSKIEAVKIAVAAGIPAVIANGRREKTLLKVINQEPEGTLFLAKEYTLRARERWIAYGIRPKGIIKVDDGAKKAMIDNGRSLLSVGIVEVRGSFKDNDTVSIVDSREEEFARGKVNFSAKEIESQKGSRIKQEVAHRDNLVLL